MYAESFVVEQQALLGVDFIHIFMISDVKFNAKVGVWGPGLRFKSRIFRQGSRKPTIPGFITIKNSSDRFISRKM